MQFICNNCTADVVFDAIRMVMEGDYDWQTAVTKKWNNRSDLHSTKNILKDGAE